MIMAVPLTQALLLVDGLNAENKVTLRNTQYDCMCPITCPKKKGTNTICAVAMRFPHAGAEASTQNHEKQPEHISL